jgi:hypothetical protein
VGYFLAMHCTEKQHQYACPCGDYVLEVSGSTWTAWELAGVRIAEHAADCVHALGSWRFELVAATDG